MSAYEYKGVRFRIDVRSDINRVRTLRNGRWVDQRHRGYIATVRWVDAATGKPQQAITAWHQKPARARADAEAVARGIVRATASEAVTGEATTWP